MSATLQTSTAEFELVAVVASLGGLGPLGTLLAGLPTTFSAPVIAVLHSGRDSDPTRLSRLLQLRTRLPVQLARPAMPLESPGVTLVPAMTLARVNPQHQLELSPANGVLVGNGLFRSAAEVSGPRLIGVVLSGMRRDGAQGVQAVRRHGGRILAQDPATAAAPEMPAAAIATGCVDFVLPPERIASALVALTMAPGAAEFLRVAPPSWASL